MAIKNGTGRAINIMDNYQLLDQILAGDQDAFRSFIDQYQKLVFHVVYRLVSNPTDREDICQEVFLKAYQNLASFKREAKISTWLARIAFNTSVNFLGKKKAVLLDDFGTKDDNPLQDVPANDITPEQWTEKQEMKVALQKNIEELKPIYRTIISLYHWEEMTYEEIGNILDIPIGTVKNYLFRARKILKEKLVIEFEEKKL